MSNVRGTGYRCPTRRQIIRVSRPVPLQRYQVEVRSTKVTTTAPATNGQNDNEKEAEG